ncbi:MAG: ABC transporter ATP-binding protein [Candidatus Eisenbacteria bacterium]|nr:ABC transporter ATP-binding protein [Candidatus Eisenbacteria bacterium]
MATGNPLVNQAPLIEVKRLVKHFPVGRGGLFSSLVGRSEQILKAVDGVSFSIRRHGSLGLAGESGCGKTTTARLLLKLIEPTAGRVTFDGIDISQLNPGGVRTFRRKAQLTMQNPYEALNPRFTILRSVVEPLIIHGIGNHQERVDLALQALRDVNLEPPERYADQFPHKLSGGQLQRAVIARALVLHPEFVVADEPVSMLDVSVRAGILNLMRHVTYTYGLTSVYISHDLSLIRYMCERAAVMYLGRVMEIGPTDRIIEEPKHPYTQALVSAVPVPDPDYEWKQIDIGDTVPSPINLPDGCRFQDRCLQVELRCRRDDPHLYPVGPDHYTACFQYEGQETHGAEERPTGN